MKPTSLPLLLLACLLAFVSASAPRVAMAQDAPAADAEEEAPGQPTAAPDFDGAERWLNTEKPLSIKDLKGQVVLLDFWTYCCINCMHIFPDLKYLEHKYKDQPFVVIGVHSGKFDQEKDAEHIRNAVLRHNIEHPVAVDSEYKIWNAYGVNAWPTQVLIDPDGNIIGGVSGEGHRDVLDKVIERTLVKFKTKLAKPLTFKLERATFQPGVLEFPGKVLADAEGKRLFIADTNHHRVLVANLEGKVSDVVGAGQIGLRDGSFAEAQFHQPQGMALSADGKTLYVTDTENHALRAVDLAAKTVTTIAGNGKQTYDRNPDGPGKATGLSSPWAVVRIGDVLYIAMAGTHQIWRYDLKNDRVLLHAGTGRESAVDNPNKGATFSQPSGLTTDGKKLYVADSESSTIRVVDAAPDGRTDSVAGSNNLFGFGLKDAVGGDALFQHPLGVALHGPDTLYVADSFNNVIRKIDLKTKAVTTWLGTGKSDEGEPTPEKIGFYEPGGLSIAGDTLYIADTNHHRIVAVDLKTKQPKVLTVTLPK